MNAKNESLGAAVNALEVFTFNYSESKNPVRTLLENGEVFFVGSDVAKTLGYKEPHKAIRRLCRYGTKRPIPHPQNPEKFLEVLTIPEGDVFRLIINSELPSAQAFESWVMDELLPTLRRKGFYAMNLQRRTDFLDLRDVPYGKENFLNYGVTIIYHGQEKWYSLNDINTAIRCATSANQLAKKLNAKRITAKKIWVFGKTNPAWFVNELGFQLVLSGSRVFARTSQLTLNFDA